MLNNQNHDVIQDNPIIYNQAIFLVHLILHLMEQLYNYRNRQWIQPIFTFRFYFLNIYRQSYHFQHDQNISICLNQHFAINQYLDINQYFLNLLSNLNFWFSYHLKSHQMKFNCSIRYYYQLIRNMRIYSITLVKLEYQFS